MPANDYTSRLKALVGNIIAENELVAFQEYWNLGQELIAGLPVRAFYAINDDGYANLAILTDKAIIDIEADDEDETAGDITVITIKAVAEVYFRAGPVQTIPNSEESRLTLVLSMIGATDTGRYWIAETDAECQHLTRFGKALTNAINEL